MAKFWHTTRRRNRRSNPRQHKQFGYGRRLRTELLEDRRMLANAPIFNYAQAIGGSSGETAYDLTRDVAGNLRVVVCDAFRAEAEWRGIDVARLSRKFRPVDGASVEAGWSAGLEATSAEAQIL